MPAHELMRRFLLHVLAPDFHRIRYFGLMAGPNRRSNLDLCRQLLNMPQPPAPDPWPASDYRAEFAALTARSLLACAHSSSGKRLVVETIPCGGSPPVLQDTS